MVTVGQSFVFAFLSSSKLQENLIELHIIVRTTGLDDLIRIDTMNINLQTCNMYDKDLLYL